eukprot:scaffold182000_cov22-Tisochrysis_lutea.AAC.3
MQMVQLYKQWGIVSHNQWLPTSNIPQSQNKAKGTRTKTKQAKGGWKSYPMAGSPHLTYDRDIERKRTKAMRRLFCQSKKRGQLGLEGCDLPSMPSLNLGWGAVISLQCLV